MRVTGSVLGATVQEAPASFVSYNRPYPTAYAVFSAPKSTEVTVEAGMPPRFANHFAPPSGEEYSPTLVAAKMGRSGVAGRATALTSPDGSGKDSGVQCSPKSFDSNRPAEARAT